MLKSFANLVIVPMRTYAKKVPLPVNWVRPKRISCVKPVKSGDLEPMRQVPPDELALPYKKLPEVENLDDTAKSLLTVGHIGSGATAETIRRELVERVKRHQSDSTTMEVRIALLTGRIRVMQNHLEKFPRDGRGKKICKELIDKRKKFLKYLRRWDYKRFEWILERLNLVYKPSIYPDGPVMRKPCILRLAEEKCEEIRAQKLTDYRERLLKQREALLKEYEENPLPSELPRLSCRVES